jgi:hypothetical protein
MADERAWLRSAATRRSFYCAGGHGNSSKALFVRFFYLHIFCVQRVSKPSSYPDLVSTSFLLCAFRLIGGKVNGIIKISSVESDGNN